MTQNKKRTFHGDLKVDYVCSPTSFRLRAEENMSMRFITITFFVGERIAHEFKYRGSLQHFGDRDALTELVRTSVEKFMSQSKKSAQTNVDFLGETVYSGLKEVRTKLGTLLWKRK